MTAYIIMLFLVIVIIFVFVTYNGLIKSKNIVNEAFSTMDVYLKKRWDLIPNLVEVVKEYAKYEENIFEKITTLRLTSYNEISVDKKINVNEQINKSLPQLLVISEKYPELKANQTFMELSNNLIKIEDEIANSRKYYNGSVRIYNNKIQIFPNIIIAKIFGFKAANMFEANIEEKTNVKVEM